MVAVRLRVNLLKNVIEQSVSLRRLEPIEFRPCLRCRGFNDLPEELIAVVNTLLGILGTGILVPLCYRFSQLPFSDLGRRLARFLVLHVGSPGGHAIRLRWREPKLPEHVSPVSIGMLLEELI